MKSSLFCSSSVRFVLFAGLLLSGAATQAASQCKGQTENACSANDDCRWVSGYVRKDGRQVNSHCRMKPGARKVSSARPGADKLSAVNR